MAISGQETCWLYSGATRKSYGAFYFGGKQAQAHRVAYQLHHLVDLSPDVDILHSCDTPLCCNPNHLRPGNDFDNANDRVARERQARGESNGRSKLTAEQIEEIRARYGQTPASELAAAYNIHSTHIYRIVNGKHWGHI